MVVPMTSPDAVGVPGLDVDRLLAGQRCGYSVPDIDGIEEPCDLPATGHRWYQDVGEHEDLLDAACDHHRNEGGRRIHKAEARVTELETGIRQLAERWLDLRNNPSERDRGRDLLALLALDHTDTGEQDDE